MIKAQHKYRAAAFVSAILDYSALHCSQSVGVVLWVVAAEHRAVSIPDRKLLSGMSSMIKQEEKLVSDIQRWWWITNKNYCKSKFSDSFCFLPIE